MSCSSNNCYLCFNNREQLENLHSVDKDNVPLIHKFYYCVYKTEWLNTNVPINICIHCHNALNSAYVFKKMCMENSERLKIRISSQQKNCSELNPASTSKTPIKFSINQKSQNEKIASIPKAFQNKQNLNSLQSNEKVIDLTLEPDEQFADDLIITTEKHTNDSSNKSEKERKLEGTKDTNDPTVNNHKSEKRSQFEEPINREMKKIRSDYEESKTSNDTVKIAENNVVGKLFEKPLNRSEEINEISNKQINENGFEGPIQPTNVTNQSILEESINRDNVRKDSGNKHQQTNGAGPINERPLKTKPEKKNKDGNRSLVNIQLSNNRSCFECGITRRNSNYKYLFCWTCRQKSSKQLFNCAYCTECFAHTRSLIDHEKAIHLKYKCSKCDLKFCTKNNLDHHCDRCFRNSSSKVHQCKTCTKIFTKESDLIDHRLIHLPAFVCDLCGTKFHSQSNMRRHRKNHKQDVVNVKKQDVRNMKDQDVRNMKDQDVRNIKKQDVSNMKKQDVSNMKEQDVRNMKEHDVMNVNEKDVINVRKPDVMNVKKKEAMNEKKDVMNMVEEDINSLPLSFYI